MKLSIVISAYNEEEKIEECLKSASFADEIIFVDNSSSDRTSDIAIKYTKKIFKRENYKMLNKNKNFGFTKASGDWIISLDADERITPELQKEIKRIIKSKTDKSGFKIPRKNIIFGKWIENTGWYPDYQIRLFRKGRGKFAEKHVHELLNIDGPLGKLKNNMLHYNYETISQFLEKMIRIYTISEAQAKVKEGYVFKASDVLKMPLQEFLRRFFLLKGYKDGMHGLALSFLMAFYHLVVFLRIWEINKFPKEPKNTLELFEEESKSAKKEVEYWIDKERGSNFLRKFLRIK